MSIINKPKILVTMISLFLLSSLLTGCIGSFTDETQIMQIAQNIEKGIEKKNVNLFMENISYNYSDTKGGTYYNHINHLPEEMFSKIEVAEVLADIFSMFKITQKVSIPESDILVTDIYAIGKMEIKISLEGCIFLVICTDLYNENINYNVNFIKEDDDWKIISLEEL